jgi:hypothetical protein
MKTKKIIITQTKTKEGEETNFKVEGFSNWEVMGLLSYYKDAFKVIQLRKNELQKEENVNESQL